ncbi:MAG: GFA family protein [Paraglaciecola polaris]|uniref:GFA family protein n=1 Tax=Paraglaciecola polaris TaxID=222814 RepID=UPI0030028CFD
MQRGVLMITGGCFCGDITYEFDGALRDARSCHCSRCRKAFSAQASAYALVDANTFRWLSSEHLLTSYLNADGYGVQFCSQCGSTLCGVFEKTVHGVTLGCVDGDPKVELARHIFVGSKASWETIAQGTPQYEEHVPVTT